MQLSGNTVLITGGGSGIGRGLAEAFHALGNLVIISGRRDKYLEDTVAANPGMQSIHLDVQSPADIKAATDKLIQEYPALNVLINNAGIMSMDEAEAGIDDETLTSTFITNLFGPVRMTSALIEHLKRQPRAVVAYVTSGLAFTPMATTAAYSASKAALHSYALSQRYKLRGSNVRVLEIVPPYVQTELAGTQQATDPRAMPLAEFIAETMTLMAGEVDEVLVQRVDKLRSNPGPNEYLFVEEFNKMMAGH